MLDKISIHPPRVGWDFRWKLRRCSSCISIHPPRVGWDIYSPSPAFQRSHFNPPTPCGVGPGAFAHFAISNLFQSTHPVWGGTLADYLFNHWTPISIHPPRVGWDATVLTEIGYIKAFQSTHPVWGGTQFVEKLAGLNADFNPPTPCGVGLALTSNSCKGDTFQSTRPVVGWDLAVFVLVYFIVISIHPPRVGWDFHRMVLIPAVMISIHPPRVGWDRFFCYYWRCWLISIHPPRVGWDSGAEPRGVYLCLFQSTHPVWGGTNGLCVDPSRRDFNPPTPCGVGPLAFARFAISNLFQSTHPVWGGTVLPCNFSEFIYISIHPPRVGWDSPPFPVNPHPLISIHPPRVGWDMSSCEYWSKLAIFQSTHPVWGGTFGTYPATVPFEDFNPPTPCGVGPHWDGQPRVGLCMHSCDLFQSTHPVWGGTLD